MQHRKNILCVLLIVLFSISFPVYAAEGEPVQLAGAYPQTIGKAALLMDASSGRVLYEANAHQRLAPASVTKIMTALLAVENGDLDKEITIDQTAVATPESSIWLAKGEKLTRRQLLYACMLKSANDAAVALAESVAGSEEDFVALMNRRAGQLGMKDTHFCNPHGLETKGHYTSAYDLALLSREAMNHSSFCQVVATKTKTIPWANNDYDRLLINQNRLLYRYDGAMGIKTGYTKQAGNCVVGAAQKGDLVLIAVALNSASVYQDLEQMLDYGFARYHRVTIKTSEELSNVVPVINGQVKTVKTHPKTDLAVAVTAKEQSQLEYKIYPSKQVAAPVKQGQVLGSCKIYVAGREVGQTEMLAAASVDAKPPLLDRIKLVLIMVFKTSLVVILIAFCILYLIRTINLRKKRNSI